MWLSVTLTLNVPLDNTYVSTIPGQTLRGSIAEHLVTMRMNCENVPVHMSELNAVEGRQKPVIIAPQLYQMPS